MLEIFALPEHDYLTLDLFCKEPDYTEGKVIIFDNDDDFLDFCVAPVAVFENGRFPTFRGQFTEMYKKCLDAGLKFLIRDINSWITEHKVANTRVLLPEGYNRTRKDLNVQLPVQGIVEFPFRGFLYFCNGHVYRAKSIVAYFVYKLVYKYDKTPDEIRTILRSCFDDVITFEQYEALDEDIKKQYTWFSIKKVKYVYKHSIVNIVKKMIALAADYDIHIEELIIPKTSKN